MEEVEPRLQKWAVDFFCSYPVCCLSVREEVKFLLRRKDDDTGCLRLASRERAERSVCLNVSIVPQS